MDYYTITDVVQLIIQSIELGEVQKSETVQFYILIIYFRTCYVFPAVLKTYQTVTPKPRYMPS